jgi:hypothetical protein
MKKPKEYTLISVEVPEDLYFKVLQVCLDRHETIDEFFSKAIKAYAIELEKKSKFTKKKGLP